MHDENCIIGWDIGGAHLKGAVLRRNAVDDVAQWPCELWRGLTHLDHAFGEATRRWPFLHRADHAITMTGEMTDLFEHREAGVSAIAARAVERLGNRTTFYAGAKSFVDASARQKVWRNVASANWIATASVVADAVDEGVVLDVGSTTTDIVVIRDGKVTAEGSDDASRLATRELVYVGVVRTPLCALASRVAFGSREYNVMNEFFATAADVFRLTGELRAEHDQAAAADDGSKDPAATIRRLARMIGLDARDAKPDAWIAFARAWRAALVNRIRENLEAKLEASQLRPDAVVVGAGCGSFVAEELSRALHRHYVPFDRVARVAPSCADWARTCAPSVAVALLRANASSCGS
jgi:probable H4MPT-linked C1 transfer pathway protein